MIHLLKASKKDFNEILKLFIEFEKTVEKNRITKKFRENLAWLITEHIRTKDTYFILAKYNNKIVGYLFGRIEKKWPKDTKYVHTKLIEIYVTPSVRGKNIASTLTKEFIAWSRKNGVKKIYLEAEIGKKKTVSFWKKQGFHSSWLGMKKTI